MTGLELFSKVKKVFKSITKLVIFWKLEDKLSMDMNNLNYPKLEIVNNSNLKFNSEVNGPILTLSNIIALTIKLKVI
jgi:hypothetical protein